MRHLVARLASTFVFAGMAMAGIQYEDFCLDSTQSNGQRSISIDDDVMAMGTGVGTITVFRNSSLGWEQEDFILPPGSNVPSLMVKGDTLIVGDRQDNDGAGCAYVYRHTAGSWLLDQKLIPSKAIPYGSEGDSSLYGNSVASDGTWAMVGPRSDSSGVCVFRYDGATWNEIGYLKPQSSPSSFGFDMDLDDNRLLVGSRGESARAWVYINDLDSWILEASLSSTTGIAFGMNVDINGNLVIVGEAQTDATSESNFTTVFRFNGSTWVEEPLPQYPNFGSKVAIEENIALVKGGSPRIYRVFRFNGEEWEYVQTLDRSTSEGSGISGDCALQGETAFIGFNDTIESTVCIFNDLTSTFDSCPGDVTGNGYVDVGDLLLVISNWQNPYTVDDLLQVISQWNITCP